MTVEEAVDLAIDNRRAMRKGDNPFPDRRRKLDLVPTFGDVAKIVLGNNAARWKTRTRWDREQALETHALPKLGALPVNAIRSQDVEAVLVPIWTERPVVARRLRGLIKEVLGWAVAREHRTDNPAGEALDSVLPKSNARATKGMRALDHDAVGAALQTVHDSHAAMATRLAFAFLVHTAGRSGEVRGARWSEIEIDAIQRTGIWTIPASRTKMAREHRVPLSVQAVAILDRARALRRGRRELVFDTGRDGAGAVINVTTLVKLLQGLKIDAVPHGFRSSFSSWCGDTAQNEDLREAALAHFNKDRVAAVYQRSDLLERRRALMHEWSNYIAPLVRAHPPAPTEPEAPRVRRAPPPSYSPA